MKTRIYSYGCLLIMPIIFLACAKRNFFPDPDNPGLSRLTAYGFDVATMYINGAPYINPFSKLNGNAPPTLSKYISNGSVDTLYLSWTIVLNDSNQMPNINYSFITIAIPVPKTFAQTDLLNWNGKRMDSSSNGIQINFDYTPRPAAGNANLYFVKIIVDSTDSIKNYTLSGLFNGNISNSILVTDGRFDFEFYSNDLNF